MMDKKPLTTDQRLVPVYLNGEWARTARVGPEETRDELHVTAEINPQGRLVSRGNHAAFSVLVDTALILDSKPKKDWTVWMGPVCLIMTTAIICYQKVGNWLRDKLPHHLHNPLLTYYLWLQDRKLKK